MGHDDVCDPRYLERCLEPLESDRGIALCHSVVCRIDSGGAALGDWHAPPGLSSPQPHERFATSLWLAETFPVFGLARRAALERTRRLGSYVGHDRPFLSAMAVRGRIVEVPEPLFLSREHRDRCANKYDWRLPQEALDWYDTARGGKLSFPTWRILVEHGLGLAASEVSVAEKLRCVGHLSRWAWHWRGEMTRDLMGAAEQVAGLRLDFLGGAGRRVGSVVPLGSRVVLADGQSMRATFLRGRQIVPFVERDGQYWGFPEDGAHAVAEVRKAQERGAEFLVFVPDTRWCLEHYGALAEYLGSHCTLVLDDGYVVFDLAPQRVSAGDESPRRAASGAG
jgi:hypothetical protein